jgi:hypothetical protein
LLPEEIGYPVVLKSSFVGGVEDSEPLKNYRQGHSEFPHESTIDQFFDDDQFESSRDLGALAGGAPWAASRRVASLPAGPIFMVMWFHEDHDRSPR